MTLERNEMYLSISNDDILKIYNFDNSNEYSRVLHLQTTFCRTQHMLALRSKEEEKCRKCQNKLP